MIEYDFALNAVKWDEKGLVCAVVQDIYSLRILMVAWLNREALQQTLITGFAHYYSRSRQRQWLKGEESGHKQKVHEIRLDCDGDSLVFLVEQYGNIACHTGHQSCFYRLYQQGQWVVTDELVKKEVDIYGRANSHKINI